MCQPNHFVIINEDYGVCWWSWSNAARRGQKGSDSRQLDPKTYKCLEHLYSQEFLRCDLMPFNPSNGADGPNDLSAQPCDNITLSSGHTRVLSFMSFRVRHPSHPLQLAGHASRSIHLSCHAGNGRTSCVSGVELPVKDWQVIRQSHVMTSGSDWIETSTSEYCRSRNKGVIEWMVLL